MLAILAFIVYYDIFIYSASLAGYVSSLLSWFLASLLGCLLWRRPDGAARCWFGAGVLAAVAGGGAAHLAGHLGWGHPLLFTLISDCGYAVCAACISVAVVIVNRSARRERRAGMQERSDREQLRGAPPQASCAKGASPRSPGPTGPSQPPGSQLHPGLPGSAFMVGSVCVVPVPPLIGRGLRIALG
jgi:hypothetical protein